MGNTGINISVLQNFHVGYVVNYVKSTKNWSNVYNSKEIFLNELILEFIDAKGTN